MDTKPYVSFGENVGEVMKQADNVKIMKLIRSYKLYPNQQDSIRETIKMILQRKDCASIVEKD